MNRDDLIERLKRLDEDADLMYDDDEKLILVIVGGGSLVLQQYINRATHDIDAINVSSRLVELMDKYDINSQVQAYANNFPYNYEDRLVRLDIGCKRIEVYTASLEDIVVAKLYSVRDQDKLDIESPAILKDLNWDKLDYLAHNENEAKASALNDGNYLEFLSNYETFIRRCKP